MHVPLLVSQHTFLLSLYSDPTYIGKYVTGFHVDKHVYNFYVIKYFSLCEDTFKVQKNLGFLKLV